MQLWCFLKIGVGGIVRVKHLHVGRWILSLKQKQTNKQKTQKPALLQFWQKLEILSVVGFCLEIALVSCSERDGNMQILEGKDKATHGY